MCSLPSALPAARTAFRLSKLHSNNSKLARAERGNRFYPLSCPCSVHFACHYAPPVRLAREAITTLSNSLHCEVIYSEGVPCRQKKKKKKKEHSGLVSFSSAKCVCNPQVRSVADMDSAGWRYTPFFFPQFKSQERSVCGAPSFPEHSPN